MLQWCTRLALSAPRRVVGGGLLVFVLCGVFGASVINHLSAGGFADPEAQSTKVVDFLGDHFDRGGLQTVVYLRAPAGQQATDPTTARVGAAVVRAIEAAPYVQSGTVSPWTTPGAQSALVSRDHRDGLVVFSVSGGDKDAPKRSEHVIDALADIPRDGVELRTGGVAVTYREINSQTSEDLALAEAVAIPISFLALIWVFGGLVAAALPILIGVFAIVGTLGILRLMTLVTDVSVFALNLTTAMGLALSIDYTLLIINRYREELAAGRERPNAIAVTIATAGRTVVFSAVTVGLSLAAMAVFPMYFLRSFAYAALAVVAFAVLASLLITPALLFLLGPRIDSLDVRKPARRWLRRAAPRPLAPQETFWYRNTQWVLRHAVPVGAGVIVVLLVLGAPFVGIKFGYPDERVLPSSASAHEVGDDIRANFAQNFPGAVTVLFRDTTTIPPPAFDTYARNLSQVSDVASVVTPTATFVRGSPAGPGDRAAARGTAQYFTVSTTLDPFSERGKDQLDALHAVPAPAPTEFGGLGQQNIDNVDSILAHVPWVLTIIAITTFILLFLLTGSVVLPLKALVLNVLSLTATFGALVFIFQDGHLGGFGTTVTGVLIANMPVLMFCVAFGLSMDYEIFLLSRIREEYLATPGTRADNDHAVALGIAHTGRVVTAAAVLMAIVFAAIVLSQVSFMRMFGVGLALAVLMDATLIRMLLVPAFMKVAGRANWWAPSPLRMLHERFGLREG